MRDLHKRITVVLAVLLTLATGIAFSTASEASADCNPCNLPPFMYGSISTKITNQAKVFDMPNASLTAGTQFEQFTWLINHKNQQFAFYGSESSAEIRVQHSGMCLDITGGSTANGARLQQWPCNGSPQQRFQLVPGTSPAIEYYYIKPKHTTNKCLDVTGASTANGAKIQQWDCNNQVQQRFMPGDRY